MELIKTLHLKKNLTIALVTHELNEVINCAQKFMFLNRKIPHKIFARNELNGNLLSEIFEIQIRLKEIDGQQIVF